MIHLYTLLFMVISLWTIYFFSSKNNRKIFLKVLVIFISTILVWLVVKYISFFWIKYELWNLFLDFISYFTIFTGFNEGISYFIVYLFFFLILILLIFLLNSLIKFIFEGNSSKIIKNIDYWIYFIFLPFITWWIVDMLYILISSSFWITLKENDFFTYLIITYLSILIYSLLILFSMRFYNKNLNKTKSSSKPQS